MLLHDGGQGKRRELSPDHLSWGAPPLASSYSTLSRRCSHSSVQFSRAPSTPPTPAGGRLCPLPAGVAGEAGTPLSPVLLRSFPESQQDPQRVCALTQDGEVGRSSDHLSNSRQICSLSLTNQEHGTCCFQEVKQGAVLGKW